MLAGASIGRERIEKETNNRVSEVIFKPVKNLYETVQKHVPLY